MFAKAFARSYIKYPSPFRPHAGGPWRIADLCRAYNFPTGLPGGGIIGILELGGGYRLSDLDEFSRLNSISSPIRPQDISIGGARNSPGDPADGEVLLDIQVAAAVYHYCTGHLPQIKMLWAPNSVNAFTSGFAAAKANGCDVVSDSWGADEPAFSPAQARSIDAGAEESGCTILAASGDNSSSDGGAGANVDLPAACPHVIGCGGTTKLPSSEIVWGDGTPNGMGTGGGYSVIFPPQSWQLGAPASPPSYGRMVPDLAANADPNTGYLVVINGQETPVGGTSAVAPLYAGLLAAFGKKLGFITPKLWANPGAFVDITQGSNGSYSAAIGPDPCTGLGVPNGAMLAALFAGVIVPPPPPPPPQRSFILLQDTKAGTYPF